MPLPWGRLIEGSDFVGRLAVKVAGYKDTAAGFAVASAHFAALRHAGIPYSFRPRRDPAFPFGIFVVRKKIRDAKEAIGRMVGRRHGWRKKCVMLRCRSPKIRTLTGPPTRTERFRYSPLRFSLITALKAFAYVIQLVERNRYCRVLRFKHAWARD